MSLIKSLSDMGRRQDCSSRSEHLYELELEQPLGLCESNLARCLPSLGYFGRELAGSEFASEIDCTAPHKDGARGGACHVRHWRQSLPESRWWQSRAHVRICPAHRQKKQQVTIVRVSRS